MTKVLFSMNEPPGPAPVHPGAAPATGAPIQPPSCKRCGKGPLNDWQTYCAKCWKLSEDEKVAARIFRAQALDKAATLLAPAVQWECGVRGAAQAHETVKALFDLAELILAEGKKRGYDRPIEVN
jgi:hypothetical protein